MGRDRSISRCYDAHVSHVAEVRPDVILDVVVPLPALDELVPELVLLDADVVVEVLGDLGGPKLVPELNLRAVDVVGDVLVGELDLLGVALRSTRSIMMNSVCASSSFRTAPPPASAFCCSPTVTQ